jgi:hypothetical protein
VKGVTSNTVEPKKATFIVEGNFSPKDVVDAVLRDGFYPTVK